MPMSTVDYDALARQHGGLPLVHDNSPVDKYSDIPNGYTILPAPAYSDVPDGYKILSSPARSSPGLPAAQPASPVPAPPTDMSQVPGAVPGTPSPAQAIKPPQVNMQPAAEPSGLDAIAAARRGGTPQAYTEEPTTGPLNPLVGAVTAGKGVGQIIESGAVPPPASRGPASALPTGPQITEALGGTAKVVGGAMSATAPFVAPAGIVNGPARAAMNFLLASGVSAGAHELAKRAGLSQEAQELAGVLPYFLPYEEAIRLGIDPKIAVASSAEGTAVSAGIHGVKGAVAVTPDEIILRGGILGNEGEVRIPRTRKPAGEGLEPPTIEGGTPRYSDVPEGYKVIPPEEKPVVHASNDVEDLRASAERQAPKVGDAVAQATEGVPGAKVEAVRDAKDAERIEDKTERQGVAPSQVTDISGAKVSVPDQAAAGQVLANLDKTLPVQKAEGAVTGEPAHNDIRQVQAIVDTKAPAGEPVKKAEVILQTPEMHQASEGTHEDYRKAQDLRAEGKVAEAEALEASITERHNAAEQEARQRQEAKGAIQKPSTAEVHGGPQGQAQETGRESGRVGEVNRLQQPSQEVTTQSAQAPGKEAVVRPPGSAPIPPSRLKELQSKLSTSAAPVENLRDQKVEVQDPSTGQWKPGTVLADNVAGDGERQLRRLRGVYDDGSKFNDVKPWQVRKAGAAKAREGVDFDGTLFKENSDGSIGQPIPERVASLKQRVANGDNVIIESHRVTGRPEEVAKIQDALESVGLPRLPVTGKKNAASDLVDDSAPKVPGVTVEKVATNANTPLPRDPSQAPIPPGKASNVSAKPSAVLPERTSQQATDSATSEALAKPVAATEEKPFKFRSTQVSIPETSDAYHALDAARSRISSEDLAGKGKDVGGNHLTVKYGLKAADDDELTKLRTYISSLAPFEASLGKTEMFPPTEHSEGAAVIQAPVNAPQLHEINKELDKHGEFKASDFGEYKPHATVAYVAPDKAQRYIGMSVTEGKKFPVTSISVTDREGKQEEIPLRGAKGGAEVEASKPPSTRPVGSAPVPPKKAIFPEPKKITQLGFDHSIATGPDIGEQIRAEKPALPRSREVAPGKVGEMRTSDLRVAPNKFQYKLGTDAAGTSTLLKEAKTYNPDLAGTISVWKDPADGKTYVINGHHRYELAQRTGQKEVAVRHIVAKDAAEARAVGARQNIAEGRGTPIDAAKFFRDTGITPEDLEKHGISLGEATAAKGLALSNLDDSLFSKVVKGELREGRAVAIGEATKDPAEQKAILSLVERKERGGAKVSDDTLSELIRLVKGSEQRTETTADLFGTQEINHSLALEKAEISAHIKQQLSKDKKLFGFVAKEGRATELARAGNKIDVEKSKEISTGAAQAEEVYNKLSERGGPIASILDEAARKLADGQSPASVKSEAYTRVRSEVSKTLGGTEREVPERLEAGAGRDEVAAGTTGKPEGAVEPTLPGMEHIPAERAEAAADQQGKDLTAQLTEPPKSIEGKAGEIEQKSPLFRDTEANPQGGLFSGESGTFEPGKIADTVAEAGGVITNYLREIKHATDLARDLQRGLETLDTAKQADILRGIDVMKVMKTAGMSQGDDEQIYHHLEDPTLSLKGDQEKWLDDVILPIQKQNSELYTELTEGGVPIEDYVHRVVKGKGGMLDRIAQGVKGVGSKGTLSKSAPQTKQRTYMAIENGKGDREVVSIKGGQVTAWRDGESENLGTVSTTDEGKAFIDKDGNEWKLKQATTKEIEKNTETTYYHSALASSIASNIQLNSAVRAMRFLEAYKASPEFKEIAWKGTGVPPEGWQPTKLPQFTGYYFEPRTAEVLDDYSDRLRNGQTGVLQSIQSFLRAAYLINPIIHPLNVAASWSLEKGISGLAPWKWHSIYKTGNKAVKAVLNRNQDFLDALDAGGALQSHREELQNIHKLFFDRLAEGLDQKEHWATRIAQSLGIERGNLLNLLHKPSSIAAWTSSDIMYLQAAYQYQAEHPGVQLKDALKEVGRIIPEYRLPTRIADSRIASKVMSNPLISWFGSYHYGLLRSFAESAKAALGAAEPSPGRTKAEEVGKGWDRLAMLGLVTMVLYPFVFDRAAKKLTGDEHARMRRPGAAGYVDAAAQTLEHKESVGSAIQKVITPSPITKSAVEIGYNRDLYSGRQIYDPTADWKTEVGQLGRFLLGDFGQYGQYEKANTTEKKNHFWWQQAGVQFGHSRAEKLALDIQSSRPGPPESPEDEKNRVRRREILDQMRTGNLKPFEEAREKRELTHRQVLDLERRARMSPLEDMVYRFSIPETEKVLAAAKADNDPKEISALQHILRQKRVRAREHYDSASQ